VLGVPLFLPPDRLTRPTARSMLSLLLLAAAIFAVRWVLMGFAQTPLAVVLIQCLQSFSFGFYIYTAAQMTEFLTEKTYRAGGQTMYALVQGALCYVIAGSAGGFLFERLGPHGLYFLCAAVTALGFCSLLALRPLLGRAEEARAAAN